LQVNAETWPAATTTTPACPNARTIVSNTSAGPNARTIVYNTSAGPNAAASRPNTAATATWVLRGVLRGELVRQQLVQLRGAVSVHRGSDDWSVQQYNVFVAELLGVLQL
jgi:hypothetical protein